MHAKRFKSAATKHDSVKSTDGTFSYQQHSLAFSIDTNNLIPTTKYRKHKHLCVLYLE
jgi:hypothetical protein